MSKIIPHGEFYICRERPSLKISNLLVSGMAASSLTISGFILAGLSPAAQAQDAFGSDSPYAFGSGSQDAEGTGVMTRPYYTTGPCNPNLDDSEAANTDQFTGPCPESR